MAKKQRKSKPKDETAEDSSLEPLVSEERAAPRPEKPTAAGPHGQGPGAPRIGDIEGGAFQSGEDSDTGPYVKREREADTRTAGRVAIFLLVIFAMTVLLHYVMLAWLLSYETVSSEQLDAVDRLFNALLPVVSGLVGTAVAYYFGRQRR